MGRLKPLKEGSCIGIAAPAGPVSKPRFLRGVRNLERAGFSVTYGRDIFSQNRYLAGNDARRSRELAQLLNDPKIDALLFARGGYGTQRILPMLKKVRPKIVVGFSDLTVLLAALWEKWKIPSLYGPMVATQLREPKVVSRLTRVLSEDNRLEKQPLKAQKVLRPGKTKGRLLGGCLTLVASLLGTPYEINTRGSILFLEDVDEPPHAVDRMMTQLEQAGKLRGVRGIVLGTFRLKNKHFPNEIEKVLRDRLSRFKGPVLWGVRFGHCPDPAIIPYGGIGRIEGGRLIIEKGIF
ncbi:MAG: LD-carboxypeptidase [Deltaproteobacteria bacterium]|nr:LD-carboxypeptidase [Deltaproteobacteria bacterium]MBI4374005.1 LD-carboxypeptidase [Deltaproteobacteria bacterium]